MIGEGNKVTQSMSGTQNLSDQVSNEEEKKKVEAQNDISRVQKKTESTIISTNPEVHKIIARIEKELGTKANYKGLGKGAGDRSANGQNNKSDHKKKNGQDFHMSGYSDIEVFAILLANPQWLPPDTQVIYHGANSSPDGKKRGPEHIHIGIDLDAPRYGGKIRYNVEGFFKEKGYGGPGNYKAQWTKERE
jgi:hypothetical protein